MIDCLRRCFTTYGIPDEVSSDGGPEFTGTTTRHFLRTWGVHHRLLLGAFPHSNCRAEVGVKIVKRITTDHTDASGAMDTDAIQVAALQYRNNPDPDTKLSPAMCVFGCPIRDFIPILPGRYQPHDTWKETLAALEEALWNRHMRDAERWTAHTQCLPPQSVGDFVRLQNQIGPHPIKWDKAGRVLEVRQFDQYVVKVNGSDMMTLRNRKFLRKYTPAGHPSARQTIIEDLSHWKLRDGPTPSLPGQANTANLPPPPTTLVTDNAETNEYPVTPLIPPPPPSPAAHTTGSAGGSPPSATEPLTSEPHVMGTSPPRPPLPRRILATPDPVAPGLPGTEDRPATSLHGRALKPPRWHSDYKMG